jgi:hypothetical protein
VTGAPAPAPVPAEATVEPAPEMDRAAVDIERDAAPEVDTASELEPDTAVEAELVFELAPELTPEPAAPAPAPAPEVVAELAAEVAPELTPEAAPEERAPEKTREPRAHTRSVPVGDAASERPPPAPEPPVELAPTEVVQAVDAPSAVEAADAPELPEFVAEVSADRAVRVQVDEQLAVEVRPREEGVEVVLEGTRDAIEPLADLRPELERHLEDAGSQLSHFERRERQAPPPPPAAASPRRARAFGGGGGGEGNVSAPVPTGSLINAVA